MAFTKEEKAAMQSQYEKWLNESDAIVLIEYNGMKVKDIDGLRAKVRDAGGEVHVIKNTILARAFANTGIVANQKHLEGTTAVGFAFKDPPGLAKVLTESTNRSEIFKIKGGYLGKNAITPAEVKSLADLPPLPVMRARLLGALSAPASQLARTLAEPARSLAAVVKAYSEKQPAKRLPRTR